MAYHPDTYREYPTERSIYGRLDSLKWKRVTRSKGRYDNPLPKRSWKERPVAFWGSTPVYDIRTGEIIEHARYCEWVHLEEGE